MTSRPEPEVRPETPGKRPPVVPRDLPDQQAGAHAKDPLDVPGQAEPEADGTEPDTSVPEPDESGAGRRGAPRSGGVRPDQPVPDEPSA
ncbi:hypothetical protein ABT127_23455 [Streptomyces sp. NPDC001904]|uniref:hypothetical protein n=1 Tax=Streptomyces sp. NPDC001904 TaxID=3154531 RepID=UPI0033288E37